MGGRGSLSGFPTNAPATPAQPQPVQPQPQPPQVKAAPQSAMDTQDLNELAQYMQNLGIKMGVVSLSGQTFDNVRKAASSIEQIMKEFPRAVGSFRNIRGANKGQGVMASATLDGMITLANNYYGKSVSEFDQIYDQSVKAGFHPAGTTTAQVASHEAGHVLETALIFRNFPGSDYRSRVKRGQAWGNCTLAGEIISEACKTVKQTPAGKGKLNDQLISSVSWYASTSKSDALAECVADYAANGASAQPLSVAVWNILKRELG